MVQGAEPAQNASTAWNTAPGSTWKDAVSIFQLGVAGCGSIAELRKMANLTETHSMLVSPTTRTA
jgi:hypothetical protein